MKEIRAIESYAGEAEEVVEPERPTALQVTEDYLPEQRFRPAESYSGLPTPAGESIETLSKRIRKLEEWASLGGVQPLKDIGEPIPKARPNTSGEHPLAQLHRQGYFPSKPPEGVGPLTIGDADWNEKKPYYRDQDRDRR
jgi:hypothetical protein